MPRPNVSQPLDRRTVDRLVVDHLPDLLRLARRLTGDDHTAEDLVQEALCRVLNRWKSFRGESPFRAWLMRIVVNADRDRRRRQRLRLAGELPEQGVEAPTPGPQQEAASEELSLQVRSTIDDLPERQREVALLTFGEGMSAPEVAEVLEVSVANVHTCLHLARKRIAAAVGFEYAGVKPDES